MQKVKIEVDPETQKNIDSWLQPGYDKSTQDEVRRLVQENPEEAINAFYTHLSFGTGGLRGIMGVGTNRMNGYTVSAASQGLATYLKQHTASPSVLIGYDSRNHSRFFAEETAKVLAGNGIHVFLYKELRPVPLVSFGVQHLKCTAGVMITASHNPPKYNGYKVYWSHGGQVLPPHDVGIIKEVEKVKNPSQVKRCDFPHELIKEVDGEVDRAYVKTVHALQLHDGENLTHGKELKIVYTPLHGTGITVAPQVLSDWGFSSVHIVKEQAVLDGNFPTVKTPNPEDPAALDLGVKKLHEISGDLLIATDPDADRMALVVMHHGKPIYLNGNETACIAAEHICRSLKEAHTMPPKPMFIKTIVTTELFKAIAEHYSATCLDVLTGFKYIGEKIAQWDEDVKGGVVGHHFLFGAEESYGYLLGTHARDKDAVISSALLAEAALHQKLKGKTLIDLLYEIYHQYGVYRERLTTHTFEGKEGAEHIEKIMHKLRGAAPQTIGPAAVEVFEDYLTHTALHPQTGKKDTLILPKSDVLLFWLSDHTKIVVRPSGTEPKIKVYVACYEKHFLESNSEIEETIRHCDLRVEEYLGHIKHLISL